MSSELELVSRSGQAQRRDISGEGSQLFLNRTRRPSGQADTRQTSVLSVLSGHRTDQANVFNSQTKCKVGAPVVAPLRGVLIFEGKLGWSRTERLTLASINQETS